MESKKSRDRAAEREKEQLLDPDRAARKRKKRRIRAAIVTAGMLTFTTVFLVCAFYAVMAVGKNRLKSRVEAKTPDLSAVTASQELTAEEESRWQEGWVKYQGTVYAYNEDIMTFLFMGIDKNSDVAEVAEGTNGGQADALFLAVVNPHDKKIRVIGINRNTMTDIDIYNETGAYVTTAKAQIAVQHGFGNGMEESCEYQKKAVRKLFYDLPIHGYAAINMSAIPAINDAVGGVDVKVLEDLTSIDPAMAKGAEIHLMGENAFWYVRYRDTGEFASADMRLERQKQYLQAFIRQAKAAAGQKLSVVTELYRVISSKMVTDISADEAAYLASTLMDYSFDQDSFYMLPGMTVMGERFEEFYVDENNLYEMILDIFYEKVEGQEAP